MKWTEDEDKILIENYAHMTVKQLKKKFLLNRKEGGIRGRIKLLRESGVQIGKKIHQIDDVKFTEMWNARVPVKTIAETLNVQKQTISNKRRRLGLEPRPPWGFSRLHLQKMRIENENRFLEKIKKNGYLLYTKAMQEMRGPVRRLITQRKLFLVTFCLKHGPGGYKRKTHDDIFKKGYFLKTYICSDRTALVRLICKALKHPKNAHIQKQITAFLRRYLTDAERLAVLWNLGVRQFAKSQVKSSIQVDGVIIPKKRKALSQKALSWIRYWEERKMAEMVRQFHEYFGLT